METDSPPRPSRVNASAANAWNRRMLASRSTAASALRPSIYQVIVIIDHPPRLLHLGKLELCCSLHYSPDTKATYGKKV